MKRSRLFSIFITLGFVVLGGVGGLTVGALLYTYLIPFWEHTEIDVEKRNFDDIVTVDFLLADNSDLFRDNVILKTTDGKYYNYHQGNWQLIESPQIDNSKFPQNYLPCNEWLSPPPVTYLRKTKDTMGVEFAHALAITSRCYVLLADGSLHLWTRDYGVFEMMSMGAISLVIGMGIGGIIGKVANRRFASKS